MSYSTNDVHLLREIVETGEVRLQSQLTTALASDQRALVLAGFIAATIVALVGGATTLFLQDPALPLLGYLGLASSGGLTIALFILVYAARPVDWYFPGTRPADWLNDIASKKRLEVALAERAEDIERKAGLNASVLARHRRLLRIALLLAAVSIAGGGMGLTAYFAFQHLC